METEGLNKEIERVFVNAVSQDEIFDAFRIAISKRLDNADLYKRLLSNHILTPEEIMMYTNKICLEFPQLSYPVYFWAGKVFESHSSYGQYHDYAFHCYQRAAEAEPEHCETYIAMIKMYNSEYDIPQLDLLISVVKMGIKVSNQKSSLCLHLSKLYKELGQSEKEKLYQRIGEKYQRDGL
jgi:Tfp pilus assembly protein PilF